MSINIALKQFLQVLHQKSNLIDLDENSLVVGLARVGSSTQKICYGRIIDLIQIDFGEPLHSLIIPGQLQEMEISRLSKYCITSLKVK